MECAEVGAYLLADEGIGPDTWCQNPFWGLRKCCIYCRDAGTYNGCPWKL